MGFNPRPAPKNGATRSQVSEGSTGALFQSTPRSEERGDVGGLEQVRGLAVSFNPRPAPKNGATCEPLLGPLLTLVSIHAPLRRTGRLQHRHQGRQAHGVSIHAPLRRTGRLRMLSSSSLPLRFQSTPRSEERGDSGRAWHVSRWTVSIHAPLRRTGRPVVARVNPAALSLFQSTPRSEERGDLSQLIAPPPVRCFNPRPAPKNGATGCPDSGMACPAGFQSTPRSEERGDLIYGTRVRV